MKDLRCELLAPAGNFDCLIAAVKAGADAVYAGGDRFGARAYAENFTTDELLEAVDHVHLHGRKLYLTVNTLLKNAEIGELYDYILPLYEQGLDGVIVQDIGVISLLGECFPGLPLHASTQMAITDVEGVEFVKGLGISRVVPARELSLKELKHIHDVTGMELECFIHGALCYSYSGKCLFSSIAGGRSGNRGRCAGPCRLPYDGKYLLSAKDICTLEILPELVKAGISSFKIEGRMKSKEYVAGVTGIYRRYLDRLYDKGEKNYSVDPDDLKELTGIYTRSGNCKGYYFERNGRDMITLEKPSYEMAEDDKLKELYRRYTDGEDRLSMNGVLTAYKDEKLTLRLECMGYEAVCEGDTVEGARKSPIDGEDIRKHLCKTGDSDFVFDELDVYSGDDIFIPVSAINSLRRAAIGQLRAEITGSYRRSAAVANINRIREGADKAGRIKADVTHEGCKKTVNEKTLRNFGVNCRIDKTEMLDEILEYDFVDAISIDIGGFTETERSSGRTVLDRDKLRETAERLSVLNKSFYIALPTVIRDDYFGRNKDIDGLLSSGIIDGVITDNYEGLYYLKKIGFRGEIISDIHMYALNDRACKALTECGVTMITCPAELNERELGRLDLQRAEFLLYGRLPMMISAGCTMKTLEGCKKDNGVSVIRDRLGNVFPVQRSCNECYNTILNCVPVLIPKQKSPGRPGIASYRIHFTVESRKEIKRIMEFYREGFAGGAPEIPDIKYTLGHYKRGVE